MSDERLDDEAPPEIPDLAKESGAEAGAKAEPKRDSDLDIEIEVEESPPSDPGEVIDAVEVVSTPVPAPPPRMRERLATNPATPVARASVPPPAIQALPEAESSQQRPVSQPPPARTVSQPPPARTVSQPPPARPVSQPPPARAVSQPPPARTVSQPPPARTVSQPPPAPRPVSQPPRPVSQPPRPISEPPPAALGRMDSEPPTEPYNPMPTATAPEADEEPPPSAATSYPPPPLVPDRVEARHEEAPPMSVKPMRVIRVSATRPDATAQAAERASTTGPVSGERPVVAPPRPEPAFVVPLPPAPPAPAVREAIEEADVAPDSDISFPVDEKEDASPSVEPDEEAEEVAVGDELTDEDINSPTPPATEISIDVDDDAGPDPTPTRPVEPVAVKPGVPPPPRREVKTVTPPSALDIKEAKEAQRAKQRKAWWEELFGEDFGRANARLKSAQIVQEANFIEESLGVAKGGVVLDLACGSGHHAVELARRGYGVVGYDLSLYQLAVAADVAQDAGQKLNLLQGDMREMAFEEMFDGIYCWNTSFGYFEEEKNAAVAQRIFRALRPGGMFLVDVANRDFVVDHQPSQTWFEGDGSVCMDDMSVDFITSRLRVKRSLIVDDGRTLECVYSIRLYSLHELGKVLHDVGFRVTEASGHPSTPGVFFGASSPRIIILAQRP